MPLLLSLSVYWHHSPNPKFSALKAMVQPEGECNCGLMAEIVASGGPVSYDPETQEYGMPYGDGSVCVMYYCFSCGGRLPSNRDAVFATLDSTEIASARQSLRNVNSLRGVVKNLGQPDDELEGTTVDNRKIVYRHLWKTFHLVVIELPDGNIRLVFQPKYTKRF